MSLCETSYHETGHLVLRAMVGYVINGVDLNENNHPRFPIAGHVDQDSSGAYGFIVKPHLSLAIPVGGLGVWLLMNDKGMLPQQFTRDIDVTNYYAVGLNGNGGDLYNFNYTLNHWSQVLAQDPSFTPMPRFSNGNGWIPFTEYARLVARKHLNPIWNSIVSIATVVMIDASPHVHTPGFGTYNVDANLFQPAIPAKV